MKSYAVLLSSMSIQTTAPPDRVTETLFLEVIRRTFSSLVNDETIPSFLFVCPPELPQFIVIFPLEAEG